MTKLDKLAIKSLRNFSKEEAKMLIKDGWKVQQMTNNSISYVKNGKTYIQLFVA